MFLPLFVGSSVCLSLSVCRIIQKVVDEFDGISCRVGCVNTDKILVLIRNTVPIQEFLNGIFSFLQSRDRKFFS